MMISSHAAAVDVPTQRKDGKKPRRRMKAIYLKIKEQMEFYFSDSNLHKDRFLKKAIEATEDRYIALSEFLKFNKIKALTDDMTVIGDAVAHKSDLLQVNEDKTKVRRVKPLGEPKNIDERTVYVECLPSGIDHDWVKRTFSPCGRVAYVSLPRYRTTGDRKGFAFVEFEAEEGAIAACKKLNNPPAESVDRMGMFPKSNKPLDAVKKQLTEERVKDSEDKIKTELSSMEQTADTDAKVEDSTDSHVGNDLSKSSITESQTDKKSQKRSRRSRSVSESSVGSASDGIVPKRKKLEVSFDLPDEANVEETEKTTPGSKKKSRKKKSRSKTLDSIPVRGTELAKLDTSMEKDTNNIPEKKRKPDKENVSDKTDVKESGNMSKVDDVSHFDSDVKNDGKDDSEKKSTKRRRKKKSHKPKLVPELRVIPKKQWLVLREEYLKLQKASMTMLKKTLGEIKVHTDKPGDGKPVTNKKDVQIEFMADVIVAVSSDSHITRKNLKARLGEDIDVAYIDVNDGHLLGHIRCKDPVSAKKIVALETDDYTFAPVSGEEEKIYWDKLIADREAKFNSKARNKKRGHQKWTEKAQNASIENVERKHVIFDDND